MRVSRSADFAASFVFATCFTACAVGAVSTSDGGIGDGALGDGRAGDGAGDTAADMGADASRIDGHVDSTPGADGVSTDGAACESPESLCAGACVDTRVDHSNCGACGHACTTGTVCSAGACTATCGTGLTACSGGCVDTQTDTSNCGTCGHACSTGEACASGTCALTCTGGLTHCAGTAGGYCANTLTDMANCGTCGNVCPGTQVCMSGVCGLACGSGLTACGSGASMACVNTATDGSNCGSCGNACTAGSVCTSGLCVSTCAPPSRMCGASCVNTANDPDNCNACGIVCPTPSNGTAVCASGICAVVCNSGYMASGSSCVPVTMMMPTMVTFPSTTSTTGGADFPGPLGSGGGGERYQTGDFVEQSFARSTPVTQLTVNFTMSDYTGSSCGVGTLTWNVVVDGVVVGSYSWLGGFGGPTGSQSISQTYSFGAITPAAGSITLEFIATTTVCPGGGSWNWFPGGTATLD